MGELVVSEKSIEYKKSQSSEELLLRIFKETYKDGVIVIDNEDNILFINEIAKKLIGPLLQNENGQKVNLPYSISKERIVHLKVNPNNFRTISIRANKFVLHRKKYHLLIIKKSSEEKDKPKKRPLILEKSNSYLHYIYEFETKKFTYINNNIKNILNFDDNQTDLRSSIVEKINYSDKHFFIDIVNEVESSQNIDEERFFEINYRLNYEDIIYFIHDFINIIKYDGKLKKIESNAIILNSSVKFINGFSENDNIQKLIGNNLSIGLYKIDLIKKTFEVSDSFYKFLGYQKNELEPLFDNFKSLIHPDYIESYILSNKNFLISREKFFQRELRLKTNTGNFKRIESRGTVISYDETGQPSKIIGLFFDKTTEYNLLVEMEYYQKLFHSLIKNSNDIIFVVDEKGKLHHLSQSVEKLIGVKNKEFLNKNIWDTLMMTMSNDGKQHVDYDYHKTSILDLLRSTINSGKYGPATTSHLDKNGNSFILETSFYSIDIKSDNGSMLMAISKDLTGLKIIKDELSEHEIIYNELMDNSTDAIVVFEPENEKIIYANNVAAKLYGINKSELINRSMLEFSMNTELGRDKVKETVNKKGAITFKTKHKNTNGKQFQVQITGSYINYKGLNVILSINKFIKFLK